MTYGYSVLLRSPHGRKPPADSQGNCRGRASRTIYLVTHARYFDSNKGAAWLTGGDEEKAVETGYWNPSITANPSAPAGKKFTRLQGTPGWLPGVLMNEGSLQPTHPRVPQE